MTATTIKIHEDTKFQIDQFREYKNESYDEVLKKLVYIAKKTKSEPELSKEAIKQIEAEQEKVARDTIIYQLTDLYNQVKQGLISAVRADLSEIINNNDFFKTQIVSRNYHNIASDKSSTIVFPLPIDFMHQFFKSKDKS